MDKHDPNLSEWVGGSHPGRLFTCCRPGRWTKGFGKAHTPVPAEVIDSWAKPLLMLGNEIHIVSLLGKKNYGYSEFEYYPFRSEEEANGKPTFQHWLDSQYGKNIVVHEYPQ